MKRAVLEFLIPQSSETVTSHQIVDELSEEGYHESSIRKVLNQLKSDDILASPERGSYLYVGDSDHRDKMRELLGPKFEVPDEGQYQSDVRTSKLVAAIFRQQLSCGPIYDLNDYSSAQESDQQERKIIGLVKRSQEGAFHLKCRGDFMAPTIRKNEIVECHPLPDFNESLQSISGIYFFRLDNIHRVARLRLAGGDTIEIIPDNKIYEKETLTISNSDDFAIIAEVVL